MQIDNSMNVPGSLTGARALVVDDDALVRELIATLLRRRGMEVCEVSSVAAAWSALETQSFDVLVSDLEMPELDGYDLIARVRTNAEERVRRIPAMAVTGRCSGSDREQLLALGFDSYLAKPFSSEALVDAVRDVMTVRSVQDSRHVNCSR
jgi:CheY-like chemotaxis protein